jgi:hypothetical protein
MYVYLTLLCISLGEMASNFSGCNGCSSKTKGLFGWAVAVKKVVVCCELWKKLLWVASC